MHTSYIQIHYETDDSTAQCGDHGPNYVDNSSQQHALMPTTGYKIASKFHHNIIILFLEIQHLEM